MAVLAHYRAAWQVTQYLCSSMCSFAFVTVCVISLCNWSGLAGPGQVTKAHQHLAVFNLLITFACHLRSSQQFKTDGCPFTAAMRLSLKERRAGVCRMTSPFQGAFPATLQGEADEGYFSKSRINFLSGMARLRGMELLITLPSRKAQYSQLAKSKMQNSSLCESPAVHQPLLLSANRAWVDVLQLSPNLFLLRLTG